VTLKRETFDEMNARIKAEVLRDEIDEGILPFAECRCDCVNCVTGNHRGCYYMPSVCPNAPGASIRVTGTACEPRLVPKSAGDRYCALCDAWMRARVCKACGLETEKC
jgi:hypothetical protein